MDKKSKSDWLAMAEQAAENAVAALDSGNGAAMYDWQHLAAAHAAVAQAAALARTAAALERVATTLADIEKLSADNNDRTVSMLDRIATALENDNPPPAAIVEPDPDSDGWLSAGQPALVMVDGKQPGREYQD